MLQRRSFLSRLGCAAIGAAALASEPRAQRVTQPIARPPGQGLARGRFERNGGVAAGALPGIYTIVSVDRRGETLLLRDLDGRTDVVHVNADLIDLDSLAPGDEVEVDFLVPEPGSNRLEAASVWKVQG